MGEFSTYCGLGDTITILAFFIALSVLTFLHSTSPSPCTSRLLPSPFIVELGTLHLSSQPSASPQLQYFLPLLLLNDQFGSLLTALKVSGHIFYLSQKLFRAFCPESFCACNSAIRKVLAFCASGWYLEVCRWLCSCVCSSPAGAQGCREPGTGRQSLNVRRGRSTKQVLSITRCPQLSLPPPT